MVYPTVNFRSRLLTRSVFIIFVLVSCLTTVSTAQEREQDSTKLQEKAIKVYLDVSGFDNEHIKREIPFVNYVRDRKQAQVHIMMTTQRTGSGGGNMIIIM